jgi:rhodanese-related sulfurtransferase
MLNTLILIAAIVAVFVIMGLVKNKGISLVSAEEAKQLMENSGAMALDVRTPQEFSEGHLKGAKLIPVAELGDRIGELDSLKERQIIVYCHSGNRSAAASRILGKNGFAKVANLRGGIMAWNSAGFKTVRGK